MKFKNYIRFLAFFLISAFIFNITAVLAQEEEEKVRLTNGVVWVHSSDEYRICAEQAYENACESLKELAKNEEPGKWCVVIDIDDTMISTVNYVIELESQGDVYSDKTWNEWYEKKEATPIEGAVKFVNLIKELGGKVVIITNTKFPLREYTLEKLDTLGFSYDICLMREGPYKDDKTKVERRKDVLNGTIKGYEEYENTPPLKIIMKVGDAVHDLYDPSRYSFQDIKDKIGKTLIILPNPLYGGWVNSPSAFVPSRMDISDFPIIVTEGQEFEIPLASNATTGYKWELAEELDKDYLSLISDEYIAPQEGAMGAGGTEVWKFKGLKAGKTLVTFQYLRTWEEDVPPVETKKFFIIIK